jgi:DNA-binding CsgD family transcriptional regulator
MRQQDYLEVSAATNKFQFRDELVKFAHKMNFGLVTAALAVDTPGETPFFDMVGNTPEAFLQTSRDMGVVKRDPIIARMRSSGVPFTYNQSFYVNAKAGDLWEAQAEFGYRTGIAMAMHLPGGRHFLLGVDRHEALPEDDAALTRLVADLQLLAAHAQETAVRVLLPAQKPLAPVEKLTAREREVLQWCKDGKTVWEAAKILGISEYTARFHVRNAIRKLGVSGIKTAILRALSLNLI